MASQDKVTGAFTRAKYHKVTLFSWSNCVDFADNADATGSFGGVCAYERLAHRRKEEGGTFFVNGLLIVCCVLVF